MTPPPFDVAAAHRWFAVAFNNRAWDLVELDRHTDEKTQEMIHAAHAAAIHWKAVGTALNAQRAEVLLATAYIKANHATPAMHHAQRALALSKQDSSALTPFDRAMTLAVCAKAHGLSGSPAEAQRLFTLAAEAAGALPDDDRAVFNKIHVSC